MSLESASRMALASALLLATVGCVTYRGPRGIETAIEEQMGVDLEREFGLKLGLCATKLTGTFLAHESDEDALAIENLTGVGVAVFKVPPGASKAPRLDPARLGLGRFETVLNIRDGDGQVLLLTKSKKQTIHEVVFVAADGEEVVVARLRGDLDRLVGQVMHAADEDGVLGARRAVTVATR
jgi:hypothetical protein